ncbi:MAG: carboxypeptidase-like regulatory domain-containing protein [Cyanobacteria bacterium]|nr:carboxypeptidase-like regulatory domain-containing protein [Cyanobacteriota bacterium]
MFLALALILTIGAPAYAQGSIFSTLSGTVVDAENLPIPGANVKIKNNGTGQEIDLVSGGDGGFTAPNINSGNYSVTVELAGFRTTTLSSVSVAAGIPTAVRVTMQVGTISENVMVVGESATVVQSQSPAISTNLTGQQITSLPLTSRNALDSLTSLAGFNTSGTARNSTVSGLPRSAINITLDGMSVQDNYLKTTDGFFARLSPLLDSVEEVTVTTAGNTADATGQGAVQIRFVTKAGTNRWIGTAYEYLRHDALNANSWFRNRDLPPDPRTGKAPKDQLRSYTSGIAQGGPIKRNKAFFFFNYEEERRPAASTLQRIILTPQAASGIFTYGNGLQQNLLQIAAANGQLATIDPTVGKILGQIQAATSQTGGVTALNNPLVQQYTWSMPTRNFNPAPTVRLDYEITRAHRLNGSFNYRHINSTPDTTNGAQLPFPNSLQTGSQQSTRWTTSESLRSTFGDSVFNEFRVGGSGGATLFSPEFATNMFSDTGGYRLNFNGACCGTGAQLTNWSLGAGQSSREASTKVVENTTTWLTGNHNMQFGAVMVQADVWLANQTLVPTANFGVNTSEAADAIFNATTLPGASAADITQAKNLYAMLTGRLLSLTGDARINAGGDAYNLLGASRAEGRMREFNVFVSDSWRATPSLTVSAGVRYVLQNPFYPTNDSYTTMTVASLYGRSGEGNIGMPGTLTGAPPQFIRFPAGQYAYNPDRNNLAPSLGAAWQVPPTAGLMKWLRGSEAGDVVVRGGWAMAYQRPGLSDFTGVFGDNQGIAVSLIRDQNNATLPIVLRNTPTLPGAPAVTLPAAPASITTRGNAYDPGIQLPQVQSWSTGWQRKVSRDSAIEVRYVGSRLKGSWDSINLNEPNITSNGFLTEFRQAQANLQANIAAGRGATFAYMGAGTGTAPLPILLAHFNAQGAANAGNQTLYTGANWTSATFLGFLAARNPNPWGFASAGGNGLIGNATLRTNAINAGLPSNFFVANPDLLGAGTTAGAAQLITNSGGTRAHSMQFEYRKRFSNSFSVNSSYTFSVAQLQRRFGYARPNEWIDQAGQVGNVRHAVKANWSLQVPIGKDRKFGANLPGVLDAIVGGWSFDGVGRVQTGEVLDFGNVRLVGMTKSELQKQIKVQQGPGGQIFILPADILNNTVKAFSVSPTSASGYGALGAPSGRYFAPANGPDCIETAPGYGDCGARSIIVNGPKLVRFDIGIAKKFDLRGRFVFEFRGEMLNAFNTPYFNPASTGGTPLGFTTTTTSPSGVGGGTPTANTTAATNVDNYRLTALLGDNTSRLVQLVWRLRW